jgi:hypothetical protein
MPTTMRTDPEWRQLVNHAIARLNRAVVRATAIFPCGPLGSLYPRTSARLVDIGRPVQRAFRVASCHSCTAVCGTGVTDQRERAPSPPRWSPMKDVRPCWNGSACGTHA